ncbi:MAG: sigma-70 family RNA polymerase sigma factor [Planctomycetes bacterium]|nr:sigma-70 family RNA polymerase sigma factor [Planctomycetota bacterium]
MVFSDSHAASPADLPEPESFDRMLERHLPAVRTLVRMNLDPTLRSREAVSDLVQSSVRELLAVRDGLTFQNDEAFRAYLFTCVTNKIFDKRRYWSRRKRESSREHNSGAEQLHLSSIILGSASSTPSALAVQGEQIVLLQQAFDGLDEREKKLFSMRFIFGFGPTHIGQELGLAEQTVRRDLARLQATLASIFDLG